MLLSLSYPIYTFQTCPVSKRKNTAQCNKIFVDMTHTAPDKTNVTKEKLEEIMKHYHHVFMPQPVTTNLNRAIRKKHSRTVKKPVYDFDFLNSKDAPPVRVISLTPEAYTRRPLSPLILKPVYLRPEFGRGPVNDGVFRSNPWLQAHVSTGSFADISSHYNTHYAHGRGFPPTSMAPYYETTPAIPYNKLK